MKKPSNSLKGVIYTCITGGYDHLIQHHYQSPDYKYVCFTNDNEMLAKKQIGIWEIRQLQYDKLDNVKNARWHKTHPHLLFPDYEQSIWIDSNGDVLSDKLFKLAEEPAKLLVPDHFSRRCIYDECVEVEACKKETPDNVENIRKYLRREKMPENYGLNETNILIRRHHDKSIVKIMEEWWNMIEKYSRRDQLSFSYILWKNGIAVEDISFRNARFDSSNFTFQQHINEQNQRKIIMKIFTKEKRSDGRRIIYLFGRKILSYHRKMTKKKKENCDNTDYYRSLGVKIGEGTQFVVYPHQDDHPNFGSEPFLIEIGKDCLISFGVTFLTHDGSRKVCLKYIKESLRKDIITWKKIRIGNNVFIGCHSIIMPGITIGDDVVIGAGSIVTKDIPNGEVWAGNPAKYIKTTKELAQSFEQLNETDAIKEIKKEFADKLTQIKKIGE